MPIKSIRVTRFDGGMSDDVRDQTDGVFAHAEHFNITSNPSILSPYRAQEAESISGTSTALSVFELSNFVQAGTTLYGLGRASAANTFVRILEKANVSSGDWALSSSATSTAGSRFIHTFTEYKNYIYGFKSSAAIWRYGDLTTGAKVFTETWQSTAATILTTANGHVAKDDCLYLPYNNVIAKWNNTTYTDNRLILPTSHYITSLDTFGNYLAIAMTPKSAGRNCFVYLWDLVSDDISTVIDFGEGALKVMGVVGSSIVAVIETDSSYSIRPEMLVKVWSGGEVTTVKRKSLVDSQGTTASIKQVTRKSSDSVKFTLGYSSASASELVGIYSIRKNRDGRWTLVKERRINGTTGANAVHNFIFIGDYAVLSFSPVSSTIYSVEKTNDAATYTTSVYESQKFNGGTPEKPKELVGVKFSFPPLVSAGVLTFKYRVNEETSWTTIGTISTDNATYYEAVNENGGSNFDNFNEVQFRIESTGGAEVGGFKIEYREVETSF